MTEPVPTSDLGYAEALNELEQILDRLEHADPDVDRIAVDVSRAADLVARCRERIEAARTKVGQVVDDLVAPTESGATGPPAEGDDPTDQG